MKKKATNDKEATANKVEKFNNNDIVDNEISYSNKNDLNNITNSYFNSLDKLLIQPNNSKFLDIENLMTDALNQYKLLINKEIKKTVKNK
jgi:hypothetical protein